MGHSASLRLLYLDANDYVSELAGVWGVRSLYFCLKLYLDFKEFSVNCLLELSLLTETWQFIYPQVNSIYMYMAGQVSQSPLLEFSGSAPVGPS